MLPSERIAAPARERDIGRRHQMPLRYVEVVLLGCEPDEIVVAIPDGAAEGGCRCSLQPVRTLEERTVVIRKPSSQTPLERDQVGTARRLPKRPHRAASSLAWRGLPERDDEPVE